MNTTITIDKTITSLAAKKAKKDKLSVSAVMRILLTDYAKGKIQIGTKIQKEPEVEIIQVDSTTQKKMDEIVSLWRNKK